MSMNFIKGKRFFTTKVHSLLNRPELNKSYPYEFLRKMSEKEANQFVKEVRIVLKNASVPTKNINAYNRIFNAVIEEREDIYQQFKIIENDKAKFHGGLDL